MSPQEEPKKEPHRIDYPAFEATPTFVELKKRHRSFVIPVLIGALLWYLLYVILATYASAWMATPVIGVINIGLILGLLQFVTTFAITSWYVSYANKKLDPLAAELRHELEAKQKAGVA
jgi:uncharacterized membrane protein (DUF485 family)